MPVCNCWFNIDPTICLLFHMAVMFRFERMSEG